MRREGRSSEARHCVRELLHLLDIADGLFQISFITKTPHTEIPWLTSEIAVNNTHVVASTWAPPLDHDLFLAWRQSRRQPPFAWVAAH